MVAVTRLPAVRCRVPQRASTLFWLARQCDGWTSPRLLTPPLEIIILPLLAHLAWKRLQIYTDLLRIITSTADERSIGTNIDDLERPWTATIRVFSAFFSDFWAAIHILSVNCTKTIEDRPGQPAYEMFGFKRRFQRCKVQWGLRTSTSNLGTPLKTCDFCYCRLI